MFLPVLLAFVGLVSGQDDSKPNIIFILMDDAGYGDIGVYSVYPQLNSHVKILTPNIDNLAAGGIQFTDAYAGAPVCTPSRCALMTGKHLGHCTARANGYYIGPDDVTVAMVMKDAGYDTALFGKWGIGYYNATKPMNDPITKGFDTYVGQNDNNNCHNYYPSQQYRQNNFTTIENNFNASREKCGMPNLEKCSWSGDLWTSEALSYISSPDRHKKPFFMYLAYTTPHSGDVGTTSENGQPIPRITEGPYYGLYNDSWPYDEVEYATAITMVDEFVGMLVQELAWSGLKDNTVIFVSSDNGANNEGGQDYKFFASSGLLQGYKRSLHEGGWRADLIVSWPGVTKPGQISDYQWTFYDLLATAGDLGGNTNLPENDGTSMAPLLKGQSMDQKDWVYTEYCQPNENKSGWGQALRMGNYTGLCIGDQPKNISYVPVCDSSSFLLYDLSNDIGQTTNIASSNSDMVNTMLSKMKELHTTGGYCTGA